MKLNRILLLAVVTALGGCSRHIPEPDPEVPVPAAMQPPRPTPEMPRDVRVVWQEGDANRTLRGIYTGPLDRTTVESRLRQIYDRFSTQIRVLHEDDKWKGIYILLATSEFEEKHFAHFAVVQTDVGPVLPPWERAKVTIKPRDPQTRPSVEEERLALGAFNCGLDASRRAAIELEGRSPDVAAVLESKRKDELEERFLDEFLTAAGKTRRDVRRAETRHYLWWAGLAATDQAVDDELAEQKNSGAE